MVSSSREGALDRWRVAVYSLDRRRVPARAPATQYRDQNRTGEIGRRELRLKYVRDSPLLPKLMDEVQNVAGVPQQSADEPKPLVRAAPVTPVVAKGKMPRHKAREEAPCRPTLLSRTSRIRAFATRRILSRGRKHSRIWRKSMG